MMFLSLSAALLFIQPLKYNLVTCIAIRKTINDFCDIENEVLYWGIPFDIGMVFYLKNSYEVLGIPTTLLARLALLTTLLTCSALISLFW